MELMESVSVLGDYRNTSLIMTITRQPQMKKKKKKKNTTVTITLFICFMKTIHKNIKAKNFLEIYILWTFASFSPAL